MRKPVQKLSFNSTALKMSTLAAGPSGPSLHVSRQTGSRQENSTKFSHIRIAWVDQNLIISSRSRKFFQADKSWSSRCYRPLKIQAVPRTRTCKSRQHINCPSLANVLCAVSNLLIAKTTDKQSAPIRHFYTERTASPSNAVFPHAVVN